MDDHASWRAKESIVIGRSVHQSFNQSGERASGEMGKDVSSDKEGGTSRLTRTCKEEPQFPRSFFVLAWRAPLGVGSQCHVALELMPGGITFGGASENGHYGSGAEGLTQSLKEDVTYAEGTFELKGLAHPRLFISTVQHAASRSHLRIDCNTLLT